MSTPKPQNMNRNNLLSSEISSENHSDIRIFSMLDGQLIDWLLTVFSWFCLHEATSAIFPEKARFFSLVKPILFWKFMMYLYKEKYRGGPQKSPASRKTKFVFFRRSCHHSFTDLYGARELGVTLPERFLTTTMQDFLAEYPNDDTSGLSCRLK